MIPALVTLLLVAPATDPPTLAIRVDQVGYALRGPKLAVVVAPAPATTFSIRSVADSSVAWSGALGPPVFDPDSGDQVQAADFTPLAKSGDFYVDVPGVGRSWNFKVDRQVHGRALYLAMRSFYGQRCGTAIDLGAEFPTYAYPACHKTGAYHASSGRSGAGPSHAGWHDAGDYGRYVVNSSITTGTLLWAYELFPGVVMDLPLAIPESANAVPDFLDEIRWNLEWMRSMQDADGGVFHKQTSENFSGFVMPDRDTLTSYVIGTGQDPFKSSCATAGFAAVMATAARVYRPFDARFAGTSLEVAQKAWGWLGRHPNVLFKNPPGVKTGEYGDGDCGDERLWAAAELARTTGQDVYERYVRDHYQEHRGTIRAAGPPAWPSVGALALWAYALGNGKDTAVRDAIVKGTRAAADQIVERSMRHGYRISMTADDYVWGSNGVAANYGLQLLVANALAPDPRYVDAARDNLHYLLGRNTFSMSWVTRVGANPFRKPHHRPSGADPNDEPWPGLLSGGPNRGRQDAATQKLSPELPPAKMYVDEEASYASNENAINWNAPLVFVLAGVLDEE